MASATDVPAETFPYLHSIMSLYNYLLGRYGSVTSKLTSPFSSLVLIVGADFTFPNS